VHEYRCPGIVKIKQNDAGLVERQQFTDTSQGILRCLPRWSYLKNRLIDSVQDAKTPLEVTFL
jgi:hypothetical protein